MDMTRRQFTVALAAATYLRPSLFEPLSPLGVPRGVGRHAPEFRHRR
jgi:hypothetical protein